MTPLPREGNAPVRIAETDVGMLNSIGLANPGRDAFLAETLPQLRELGVPVWISVGGFAAHEYAETCAQLDDVTVELNLSCPNVEEAADTAAAIVAACRAATDLPLYAKLSPANWDIAEVARAVQAAGADGLSLVNTIRGTALDERTLEPRLGTWSGGLSGPALKPIALAAVFACWRATQMPIVGMGGVMTGRDALELVAAGAQDVALGTVLFRDPDAPGPRARRARGGAGGTRRCRRRHHPWRRARARRRARIVRVAIEIDRRCEVVRLARSMVSSTKAQAQAPARSRDQRMEALKRANDIRVRRAKLKKDLKDGRVKIETILNAPPEYVSTAKVFDILMAVPKFGRVKAARFLNQCRISQSKTVGGLSERQRAELVGLFARH